MITVYHGATTKIECPLVDVGRKDLDFGEGFYMTILYIQAERWAERLSRQRMEPMVINCYQFDDEKAKQNYRYLKFAEYDMEWLNFIVASRKGECPWKGYDCIEGGVANDRVIDTVEGYIAGTIDAEHALIELSKNRPNNQICVLSQQLAEECIMFDKEINKGYAK